MRRRVRALFGTVAFLIFAPGAVAGLVPWWMSRWRLQPPLGGLVGLRWIGVALILAGAAVLLDAFARFAWQGLGTPAPAIPTQRLVVSGLYRHVRNPMYWAVTALIVGQALLLGDGWLIGYAAVVALAFHLFVFWYEEPTLRRSYGADYLAYCTAVPRWIPRLRPWSGSIPPERVHRGRQDP
jgi:protein-S-isoprenylcysteine O-methyltransferase Ste14